MASAMTKIIPLCPPQATEKLTGQYGVWNSRKSQENESSPHTPVQQ